MTSDCDFDKTYQHYEIQISNTKLSNMLEAVVLTSFHRYQTDVNNSACLLRYLAMSLWFTYQTIITVVLLNLLIGMFYHHILVVLHICIRKADSVFQIKNVPTIHKQYHHLLSNPFVKIVQL